MDIVIVAQYLRDIENFSENNSRFVYLAKMLSANQNNKIEIITSDFNHAAKRTFSEIGELTGVKITAVHESGYPKNVSLRRFKSHRELSKNITKYLSERQKPDVIYCAVPSLDVGEAAANYCKKNEVKFIVDVQDLWPEAFKMIFQIPLVSNLIFAPMQKQADRIYEAADCVAAVSQTYAKRAMKVNQKCRQPTVVYLGTEKDSFDKYADNSVKKNANLRKETADSSRRLGEERIDRKNTYQRVVADLLKNPVGEIIRMAYCGTLGHSYDITCVLEAMRKLNAATLQDIQFIVMGDGPKLQAFEEKAVGLPVVFTGRLSYSEMVWLLYRCDIAVNPIAKGAAQSIINKHMDYAMAGLPVINTQECMEYRDILSSYNAGINCGCENVGDFAKAIETLVNNEELRRLQGLNSLRLGTERFDRNNSYQKLVSLFV